MDRLFVPLANLPFAWFRSGEKKWELRRFGKQYTPKHVRVGRCVELRRGYKGPDAIWGKILDVVEAKSIDEFFDKISFKDVIPTAHSRDDAVKTATDILKVDSKTTPVLGFEVGASVTTRIPLAADLVPLVLNGRKTSTVRLGIRDYPLGAARIVSGTIDIPIDITKTDVTKVGNLSESVARTEGYEAIDELISALMKFYPTATNDDDVTVVYFRLR